MKSAAGSPQTAPLTRERELAQVRRWARAMLDDPDSLLLDTETTGLNGYLVEIAITDREGAPVFQTLVNPQTAIEAGAQKVHGISAAELVDAPTFADIEPKLRELLQHKTVVIYNAAFDMGVLQREIARQSAIKSSVWLDDVRAQCAMEQWAIWWGDYSESRGGYRWQRLNGGHRALEDCRACLALLHRMALDWRS